MNNLLRELLTQKGLLKRQLQGLDELLVSNSRWQWLLKLTNTPISNPSVSLQGEWVKISFDSGVGHKTVWYTPDASYEDFEIGFSGWWDLKNIYI